MKTKLITLFIICFWTNLYAQNPYYWYEQQKIYLTPDSSKIFVKLSTTNVESIQAQIQTQLGAVDVSVINAMGDGSNSLIISLLGDSQNDIKSFQESLPQIDYITPSFQWNNEEVYVSDQIIVKPSGTNSVQTLLQNYANEVTLVKSTTYNTHLLQVNQASKVFMIANQIHESSLVEWCHPNFMGGIKLSNPLFPEQYYLNNTGQFGGTAGAVQRRRLGQRRVCGRSLRRDKGVFQPFGGAVGQSLLFNPQT